MTSSCCSSASCFSDGGRGTALWRLLLCCFLKTCGTPLPPTPVHSTQIQNVNFNWTSMSNVWPMLNSVIAWTSLKNKTTLNALRKAGFKFRIIYFSHAWNPSESKETILFFTIQFFRWPWQCHWPVSLLLSLVIMHLNVINRSFGHLQQPIFWQMTHRTYWWIASFIFVQSLIQFQALCGSTYPWWRLDCWKKNTNDCKCLHCAYIYKSAFTNTERTLQSFLELKKHVLLQLHVLYIHTNYM